MTAGNRSTAVMASRRPVDSLQFFPTPPWATRALIGDKLAPEGWATPHMSCWEPACGGGHMAAPLSEHFARVFASDVHDWGYGDRHGLDFTFAAADDAPWAVDWIITNPPFTLGEAFLFRALDIARAGVALLLRLQWLEGGERWRTVYSTDRAPVLICPFADRVPMIEGVWDPEARSATAYAWFVWLKDHTGVRNLVSHIRPGAEGRHTRISDRGLATPGEAARRRLAGKPGGAGR